MPTTLEQLQYGFDSDSRRTWRQRATTQGWDNAYAYDSLSQVICDDRGDLNLAQSAIAGIPSNGSRWDYDETGNWHGYQTTANGSASLNQKRTHDKGNRLMEVDGAASMRTDRAGRMVELVPETNGNWNGRWYVTWDAWNRIVAAETFISGIVAYYQYDGLARRITKDVNMSAIQLRHCYYNDQWRPVEERKGTETTANVSYLWGERHRDDLVRRDRAVGGMTLDETRYILMDYFSPAATTDEAGAVKERYQFSAFGLRTILNPDYTLRSSSECAMEFSFHGQFEDVETGWINYGYRYYLSELGRWASKDPIGEEGGINLFAVSDNEAVNFVDYLGLKISYDDALRDYSQKANQLTQQSIQKTFTGISWHREYCGLICCKDGDHKGTEPHPGKWNGPAPDGKGNILESTWSQDKGQVLELGTPASCNPEAESYTGAAVSCDAKFGDGWARAGAYHSHPPGDTNFSPGDKKWARNKKCRLGLGTCDESGKPVTKEFIPDLDTQPSQQNPYPGSERTL